MKILIVENEEALTETMRNALMAENFLVETAHDFYTAREKIGVYDYDCILLDLGLPGGSGLELLRELKSDGKSCGVIIVSAKDSLDDKITGLDLGADDYLPKPFHMNELLARTKSVIRRRSHGGNSILKLGNLSVNPENRTASVDNADLNLNRKEFDVLLYMAANFNRLVHKTALAEHVWGDHIDEANSFEFIYSQIKNLRKKLKTAGATAEIQAVYGVGYKLCDT